MKYFDLLTSKNLNNNLNLNFYSQLFLKYIKNINTIPNEYQRVEYIESTGTQYIDTGVNADYKLSLKMKMLVCSNAQKHMGAIYKEDNKYTRHHFQTTPNNNVGYVAYYVGENNTKYEIKTTSEMLIPHLYNLDVFNKKLQLDSNTPIPITRTNFDTDLNYWLFWRNRNEDLVSTDKGSFRIYYCKMFVEGELVRNFIPCYRKSDNEIGLYDKVNEEFYSNEGTGVFLKGDNI